ncbi:hypothetical protein SmJEL517_g03588 [Synchytrium microbalum]|uniref:Response regulatory domain-containing protein n=1 Tax=Synchytrium microbalum TaxID=1806994 RepID=A0A507C7U8_9FUNG|nr:uncharacterized protein SmJEL517_g03588 [Synchytrium microbalum]TPX33603.1 hypothetical protein SmJEL517_g03588 [Synchytrium microbalum]
MHLPPTNYAGQQPSYHNGMTSIYSTRSHSMPSPNDLRPIQTMHTSNTPMITALQQPQHLNQSHPSQSQSNFILPPIPNTMPPWQPNGTRYFGSAQPRQESNSTTTPPKNHEGGNTHDSAPPSPPTLHERRNYPSSKHGATKPMSSQQVLDQLTSINTPDFVRKLFRMLEEPGDSNTVAWASAGDAFVVKNPTEFARIVLPRHFKHNNFASFVRQLNKYGFHKVKLSEESKAFGEQAWEFQHPAFHREHLELLEGIKRKTSAPRTVKAGNMSDDMTMDRNSSRQDDGGATGSGSIQNDSPRPGTPLSGKQPSSMQASTPPPAPPQQQYSIPPPKDSRSGPLQPPVYMHSHMMRPHLPQPIPTSSTSNNSSVTSQPLPPPLYTPVGLQLQQPTGPSPSPVLQQQLPILAHNGYHSYYIQQPLPQMQPVAPPILQSHVQQSSQQLSPPNSHDGDVKNPSPQMQQQPVMLPRPSQEAVISDLKIQLDRVTRLQSDMATYLNQMGRNCASISDEVVRLRQTVASQDATIQELLKHNGGIGGGGSSSSPHMSSPHMGTQDVGNWRAATSSSAGGSGHRGNQVNGNAVGPSAPGTPVLSPKSTGQTVPTPVAGSTNGNPMATSSQQPYNQPQMYQEPYTATPYWNAKSTSVSVSPNVKTAQQATPSLLQQPQPQPGAYPSFIPPDMQEDNEDMAPTSSSSNHAIALRPRSPSPSVSEIMREFILSPAHKADEDSDDEDGDGTLVVSKESLRQQQRKNEWKKMLSVLLVEDDKIMRELYAKQLSMAGYTFDVAVDGLNAVEIMTSNTSRGLKKKKYDIVLMDIIMPRLDGVGATTQIRQFDPWTPIISMTSSTTDNDVIRYFSHGMNDVLPKPFTRDMLSQMIDKWASSNIGSTILMQPSSAGNLGTRIEELDETDELDNPSPSSQQSKTEKSVVASSSPSNKRTIILPDLMMNYLPTSTSSSSVLPRHLQATPDTTPTFGSSLPGDILDRDVDGWNSFQPVVTSVVAEKGKGGYGGLPSPETFMSDEGDSDDGVEGKRKRREDVAVVEKEERGGGVRRGKRLRAG